MVGAPVQDEEGGLGAVDVPEAARGERLLAVGEDARARVQRKGRAVHEERFGDGGRLMHLFDLGPKAFAD